MALLTREQIFSADDLPTADVDVPQWGGTVRVRSLKSGERFELEKLAKDSNDFRAQVVALCAINEDGSRAFTLDDVARLTEKNAEAMNAVFEVATKLNGLTGKQADDLEKN